MSQQLEFLRNLISSAARGNVSAVTLLRRICRSAASEAPPTDLITIAKCLCEIGTQLELSEDRA